jgi:hypothetical protein
MGNMISGKEKRSLSFYEDFKDDQISGSELFNTVGGIERVDYSVNISAGSSTSADSIHDAVWSIRYPDDELYEFRKNIPDGNNFFSRSPVFFGLWCCTFATDLSLSPINNLQ